MKENVLIILLFIVSFLNTNTINYSEVTFTADDGNSTVPHLRCSGGINNTLNAPFLYHPNSPTSPLPLLSPATGSASFHAATL